MKNKPQYERKDAILVTGVIRLKIQNWYWTKKQFRKNLATLYYNPNCGYTGVIDSLEKANSLRQLLKTVLVSRKFIRCINQLSIDSEQDELLFFILMVNGTNPVDVQKYRQHFKKYELYLNND